MSPVAEYPQVDLVQLRTMIAARSSKLAMWVWFRHPLDLLLRREVRPDRMRAMLLTSGRLGSKGNLRGFYVSLSEWIVDAFVFGAVGSDLWLFVVFIIPRFGHVYLQAISRMPGPCPAEAGPSLPESRRPRGRATRRPHPFCVQAPGRGRLWDVLADTTTLNNEVRRWPTMGNLRWSALASGL